MPGSRQVWQTAHPISLLADGPAGCSTIRRGVGFLSFFGRTPSQGPSPVPEAYKRRVQAFLGVGIQLSVVLKGHPPVAISLGGKEFSGPIPKKKSPTRNGLGLPASFHAPNCPLFQPHFLDLIGQTETSFRLPLKDTHASFWDTHHVQWSSNFRDQHLAPKQEGTPK